MNIHNDATLAGVYWDDASPIHNNLTGLQLAQEADRGRAYFQSLDPSTPLDMANSNIVVATPHRYNDAGFNKKYGGTGLGLAFTKRLVEAQGGSVGVRSTPRQGSVFHAILPRTPIAARGLREISV